MRSLPVPAGWSCDASSRLLAALAAAAGLLLSATAAVAAPPGRAYEKVSPPGTADVLAGLAAGPGAAITYLSLSVQPETGGAVLFAPYSGVRGPDGWNLIPHQPTPIGPGNLQASNGVGAVSDDRTRAVLFGSGVLDPGDQDGNTADGYVVGPGLAVEWATRGPMSPDTRTGLVGSVAGGAFSADGEHFAFQSATSFDDRVVDATPQVYERVGGRTVLVGIGPDGNPLPGGARLGGGVLDFAPIGTFPEPSAMSRDGSRIFFTGTQAPAQLYVREHGADTTQVSLSQATGTVGTPAAQPVTFEMATPSGRHVFFITASQLTDDATTGGGLYRYDVETGELDFLSGGSVDPLGARVQGVVRVSDDGRRAYFVALDDLDGVGTEGQRNLYVVNADGISRIGEVGLSTLDRLVWDGGESARLAKMTPDGSRLTFLSRADLTPDEDGGLNQVYLYDAELDELECISCPASGETAGAASFKGDPTGLSFDSVQGEISADGRAVLFGTASALVPEDANGVTDAYLWEDGTAHLLGLGTSPFGSLIAGMSDDGTDVFFVTRDRLVAIDQDGLADMYDARLGGGLRDQQQTPPAPCEGDACRDPAPGPVAFAPPSSAVFSGNAGVDERAPAFAVRRIGPAARRRLARTGRVTLRVRVGAGGRVSAEVLARTRGGVRRVARATRTVDEARTVRLRLRLSRAARRQLARRGRLRLTIRVTYSRSDIQRSARLTLRRAGRR
jgi:hypothetical protein